MLQARQLKPYLMLLLVLVVAFLPVSTFYFGLKNDAFSDNFPNKYFFSQALHSGFLPLWNPYLNFGFPIYADPGFAFWSLVTWLFGGVGSYSAYTLTIEVLLYIYLSGITMFRLGKHLLFSDTIAVAVAAMYMCSGFFCGEIQHINFLTCAAFLPFLLQQFLTLWKKPGYRSAGKTAIGYYLVFAGGHPAIPIGTVYFLAMVSIMFFMLHAVYRQNWKRITGFHLLAVFVFVMLYSPALYSYTSVWSSYGRGVPIDQVLEGDFSTGFRPSSYLSFIYPFATVRAASFLTDDLAMRNAYFSVAGLLLVFTQLKNKNYLVRSLLVAALVMLVLSLGGEAKVLLYPHLPLLQYIRTNGEFRIFAILCGCVVAGQSMNKIELKEAPGFVSFSILLKVVLLISLVVFIINIGSVGSLFHFAASLQLSAAGIKWLLDGLNFRECLQIAIIINIGVVLLLLRAKANVKKIALIIVADMVINSLMFLPFAGVGTVPLRDIQKVYERSPDGIIKPLLIRINQIDTLTAKETGLVGSLSYYNKQIGTTALTDYPSYFSSTDNYFQSSLPGQLNNLPFIFLQQEMPDYLRDDKYVSKEVTVDFFSPQKMVFTVTNAIKDSLVLLQNYNRFWMAKVDGRVVEPSKTYIAFMSVPVNEGKHTVEFYYENKWLLIWVAVSLLSFVLLTLFLWKSRVAGRLPNMHGKITS